MRIVMLSSSYPRTRGDTTAPFIEEIAAGLIRRGHDVDVVLPYHPGLQREPRERGVGLRVYRYAPHRALNVWGYAESLRADVGVRGAALIAAPLALTAATGTLWWAALSGYDVIHAHWVLPNGLPAALVAAWHRVPLVVSLHGSDVFLAERAFPLALTAATVFRSAGAITACSGELRERAIRLGAPTDRSRVIPYGVDDASFTSDPADRAVVRAELGLPTDGPLVAALGRLVYKKGFGTLIEAFARLVRAHPNARLAIAGYGELRDELEQQARAAGVPVTFVGQLDRRMAARFIAAADVYVVPSVRDQAGNVDGLPNALLEGMSAGRPIVASRVAGIPDVIDDGQHGVLVPPGDPAALAVAIGHLLAAPDVAARLGSRARRRVLHELTWEAACEQFEAAYHQARNR
jgi:glycosyltransferase involved in cell wall biosynthesis